MQASSCKKSDDNQGGETSNGTVKDIDGNVYPTVTIGTQVWMAENLKTTKYRDGSQIPNVTVNNLWDILITGAYCNYNNDAALGTKYGKLYNWYAMHDCRNIAPVGWHVASDADWTTLENYVSANLGNSGSEAKALASKTDWASSKGEGAIGNDLTKNNSSGFTALPGGGRYYNGSFYYISEFGYWWSSIEGDTDYVGHRALVYNDFFMSSYYEDKSSGYSVRCVRD